ncbi:putative glycosyltransferase 6 domain-containing protein 1 [Loxodonta africana]|uniref:putative glycosyltransferase 6 domain-containing protein 1 n=1 Tax=Loxodonta africana TaxID=9785 RepID=UPI000C813058|nr:glycosyltransferase 6 domain-containing protein 1 [Loxodonta africana]
MQSGLTVASPSLQLPAGFPWAQGARQHAALSRAREAGTLTVDVGPKPVRPLWKATSMFGELTVDPARPKRPDVVTTTDWHAPVIWEGTFNRRVLNNYYQRRNITVGLAVFAVGRFVDEYLELFIRSADKHFMVGYKVIFYVIVDALFRLPDLKLGPLRTFKAFRVNEEDLWYDLNLLRMKSLGDHIIWHIQKEADFLFSMAVNQVFQNDFGVETLGKSVAQLHRWWYFKNTKNFPYERRPGSAACIPFGLGDFYYDSSIIGGTPQEILNLIDKYLKGVVHDTSNRLNSTYESHLNKYFFLNKPTKLLSPEYNWDPKFRLPPQIEYVKVVWRSERD